MFLSAEAARAHAHAAVLSDADGLLVAGVGGAVDHHELAALAPLACDARPGIRERLRAALDAPVRVAVLSVEGAELLCASVGERALDVRVVEAAVRRIVGGGAV